MPRRVRPARGLFTLALVLVSALGCAWLVAARDARGAGEGALRERIDGGRERERSLASAAERLGRLERAMTRELAVVQRRLADVEAQLGAARARLATTQRRLQKERRRVVRLRGRLAQARATLARVLRHRYMAQRPDLVTVVLDADGFADLLERFEFLRRVRDADASIVAVVRAARHDAGREARALASLEARRRASAAAVQRQRDGLAAMRAAADQRRAALAQARAARLAALHRTRADRRSAQRTLERLLAERARAARQMTGPGGPWAIPWPIVQCESGGQNLPPNSAGASGYYQFMPDTWRRLGGSTPQAYQASKAEQDRLAAKLWAGGAGASNWVCAALV